MLKLVLVFNLYSSVTIYFVLHFKTGIFFVFAFGIYILPNSVIVGVNEQLKQVILTLAGQKWQSICNSSIIILKIVTLQTHTHP